MKPFAPCAVATLFALACVPVGAAGVHKTVGPDGAVEFSDQSPEKPASLERDITSGTPDPTLQRANDLVDRAERAVALARRPVWSDRDPGRVPTSRMTRADAERIEFYKQEARSARLALCLLLQARSIAAARADLTASYAAPADRP